MKTITIRSFDKCSNKKCGRILLAGEAVGIVGRDNLGRNKYICMGCKHGNSN